MRQLQAVGHSLQSDISRIDTRLDAMDDQLNDLGAMSMAISQLTPNPRAVGNTHLSLGVGNYEDSSAIAAGLFHHINDNLFVRASITSTSGDMGGGGAITLSW